MPAEWVALATKFTPGWPWPEDSYGLDPRYGTDGWCRGCGTPLREQTGPLTIQGSKFPSSPVWMPNWTGDVVCVSADVAAEIRARFTVELRDVHKPRNGATGAMQIIPAVTRTAWYYEGDITAAVKRRHGALHGDQVGNACRTCGRWKWLPVLEGDAPVLAASLGSDGGNVIMSHEYFGDGLMSFKHVLFSRGLGEFLAASHPRHWSVVEVAVDLTL